VIGGGEREAEQRLERGYVSPSLERLERAARTGSPARKFVEQPSFPAGREQQECQQHAERLGRLENQVQQLLALLAQQAREMSASDAALQWQLSQLDERQHSLAANLTDAHAAFGRLNQRVVALADRLDVFATCFGCD
jgi:chromosome segregation ATPase